ncbi:MAG: hypothetical protein ACXWEA_00370 [Solirubrobacterales bacterium]
MSVGWRIVLGFVGGLLAGGLIGAGAVYKLHDEHTVTQPRSETSAGSPVVGADARRLAQTFRPWLKFDSGEPWRPVSVDGLLKERDPSGNPVHSFCPRHPASAACEPLDDQDELERIVERQGASAEDSYLDIAGSKLAEYRSPDTSACPKTADCGGDPGSAIYYAVTNANGRFYIDYWWLMRFNHFDRLGVDKTCPRPVDSCDEHEGDWEGVTAVTKPGDGAALDYVVYAAHKGTFRYSAAELALNPGPGGERTRPDVYVAQGSHASYPRACVGDCREPSALAVNGLVDLPEMNFNGRQDWERNPEEACGEREDACLRALATPATDRVTWTDWAGLWGATSRGGHAHGAQSPQSPGLQPRYKKPYCSLQGGLQTCDRVVQGCSDWLGPLVAGVACNPRALATGLGSRVEEPKGNLKLTLSPPRKKAAAKQKQLITTVGTPGVVQLLHGPLVPGGRQLSASGQGEADAQLIVRARNAHYEVVARFTDLRLVNGGRRTVEVGPGRAYPVVHLLGPGTRRVRPTELRITRVKQS